MEPRPSRSPGSLAAGRGAVRRKGPRLNDVLNDCNRRALSYSKHVDVATTAEGMPMLDSHDQAQPRQDDQLAGFQKWFRRIVALILILPLGGVALSSLVMTLAESAPTLDVWLSVPVWYSLMGVAVWSILCWGGICRATFLYLYVLGHELSHALATVLSGGSVATLKVTLEGGYVITDKNNFVIALAPYFFPIWLVVWLLLATLTSLIQPWDTIAPLVFGGLGFWWAFHFYWTVWIIPKDQPDLNENGTFFSLTLIFLLNLLFVIGALILSGSVGLMAYMREFRMQSELFSSLIGAVCKGIVGGL